MSICKCLTSETVFCGKPAVGRERCADHLMQEWDDCLSRIAALEAELADVRTLVDHVKAIHGHEREFSIGSCSLVIHDEGSGDVLTVTGAPEFCIKKAAAWVRENGGEK